MWLNEYFVEFQGCFRFAKMELTIHKAYEFACLAANISYVGIVHDMSIVIWIPRYFIEFTLCLSLCTVMVEE